MELAIVTGVTVIVTGTLALLLRFLPEGPITADWSREQSHRE